MDFTEGEISMLAKIVQITSDEKMRQVPIADESTALSTWKKLEGATVEVEGKKIIKTDGDNIEFSTAEKSLLIKFLKDFLVPINDIELKQSLITKLS